MITFICHLKHLGLTALPTIRQRRMNEALVTINPTNSKIRWATLIGHRKYNVARPT